MARDAHFQTSIGVNNPSYSGGPVAAVPNTRAMSTANNCTAYRFQAIDTQPVYSVYINWGTVTTPGSNSVRLRLETVDSTNFKADGNLVGGDSNYSVDFTPVAGWQQVTFPGPPSTGLTVGTCYCVVLLTVSTGGTKTLNTFRVNGLLPATEMYAADGSTRSNLTTAASTPICTIVLADGTELCKEIGFTPCGATTNASGQQVYTHRFSGNRVILYEGAWCSGVSFNRLLKNASPGNLYVEVRDGKADGVPVVTGCQRIIEANLLSSGSAHGVWWYPVYLGPGTYYVGVRQNNTGSSTNRYQFDRGPICRSASTILSSVCMAESTDVSLASPTYTLTTDRMLNVSLILAEMPPKPLYSGIGIEG